MKRPSDTQRLPLPPAPPLPEGSRVPIERGFELGADGDLRIVFLGMWALHHFRRDDVAGRNVVLCDLALHRGVKVTALASAFGLSRVMIHRVITRYQQRGLPGVIPRQGRRRPSKIRGPVARRLLELKRSGVGNREAARRLGLSVSGVAAALRRLGWVEPSGTPEQRLPVSAGDAAKPASVAVEATDKAVASPSESPVEDDEEEDVESAPARVSEPSAALTQESAKQMPASTKVSVSVDADPRDRSADRLMARLGLLDDALPMFETEQAVPRAGVLLAVPALVESGVFESASRVFGSLGPAFYGLRTTILALLFLALLRIKRVEHLKEKAPTELGRVMGLDRVPEMKTLRRKLRKLVGRGSSLEFMRELARKRAERVEECLGVLYIDGHVRVYNGKARLPKAHVTQRNLSLPATTDYWVNDRDGAPLLVVTAEFNEGLAKMLDPVLDEIRPLLKGRRATVVFDRGGWSPKVFSRLIASGFDIITYRKGKALEMPLSSFEEHRDSFEGREVTYQLAEEKVQLLGGKLEMRQVNRLGSNGHQTQILTNRTDLSAVEVAYRMFSRWTQENFFKYMAEEFELDALVDYGLDELDLDREVPNPARKLLEKQIRQARTELAELERKYGVAAFENREQVRSTMRGFKIANGTKIGKPLRDAHAKVQLLIEQRAQTPARLSLGAIYKENPPVRLRADIKRFTDTIKMVAYQAETTLYNLVRGHYLRAEDEGRTLVSSALQSAANLQVTETDLRVTLLPLSSPHRSRAIEAMCNDLNAAHAHFPGTKLRLHFAVSNPETVN